MKRTTHHTRRSAPRHTRHSALGTRHPRVLMCAPDHFGVHYEINPWMHTSEAADQGLAARQWRALRAAYGELGVEVVTLPPVAEQPDLVFTANAGLVLGRRFVLSRFRHPERQGEERHFRAWAEAAGFDVLDPPEELSFEGAGDALFVGETLYLGHGFRTDAATAPWLAEALGIEVVPLKLADPRFYHLDTCFCPIDDETALAAPVAFTAEGWAELERRIPRLIAMPEEVAVTFACNAVRVGDVLLTSGPREAMDRLLAPAGLRARTLAMSEFRKSGGAVRCLTLPLWGLGAQPARADHDAKALAVPGT
jgi:N-dimethylarginine dimethylaminohydrolase